MERSRQPDDLIVSEHEWITFVQHDWGNVEWQYIDKIIEPLHPLFDLLEIHCVAGCCGLDAFSFTRDDIRAAAARLDLSTLVSDIDVAISEIQTVASDVLGMKRLNNAIDRVTMLELLTHIRDTVAGTQGNRG